MVVRNALVKAIAAGLDVAFIDPSNNGAPNVKPASITYGAETVVSTGDDADDIRLDVRSEEHTSELQSLMRISYAVFCLKKKTQNQTRQQNTYKPVTQKQNYIKIQPQNRTNKNK